MDKKLTIKTFICISDVDYELLLIRFLKLMLQRHAKDDVHLQLLITNKPIIRWFVTQIKKHNKTFLEKYKRHKNLPNVVLHGHYRAYILKKAIQFYPSALISGVRYNGNSKFLCN